MINNPEIPDSSNQDHLPRRTAGRIQQQEMILAIECANHGAVQFRRWARERPAGVAKGPEGRK
jgi:hypothetical protein